MKSLNAVCLLTATTHENAHQQAHEALKGRVPQRRHDGCRQKAERNAQQAGWGANAQRGHEAAGLSTVSRGSMAGPVPNPLAPSIRCPRAHRTKKTSATGWLPHVARTSAAAYWKHCMAGRMSICGMGWHARLHLDKMRATARLKRSALPR